MINCLIVDDEPLAQDILETYIKGNNNLCLIKKCSTAIEAFEVLHQQKIDLIFLDIKMPALSGIDFLKSLKNPPAVIFTTAFSEYAVTSYELEAVDYLLKPITTERFQKSLDKLFRSQSMLIDTEKEYTYFKVSGNLVKVSHTEILYAQSIRDYIMLYTKIGNLMVHMTMKYLCGLLPESQFKRIHRSYLVNKIHITAISKSQVLLNEIEIPVGEIYRGNISHLAE
ncbi:LytR/AlgR family response regulator transcription factor [Pedobacter chinensis]|uniref:LytR/AlgR family response regulator transcription factor n=1 Tax=Pedobacter chinensis TaxID=2282421 RepID=UPI0018F32068|nr:response regulator transcription factor [Pedobacter chinensis]